jgi:hypothetical protein
VTDAAKQLLWLIDTALIQLSLQSGINITLSSVGLALGAVVVAFQILQE